MSIAVLYALPDDAAKFQTWAFTHAAMHRDVIRVVSERFQQNLTEYPLDPFDPDNLGHWMYQHQVMHQQQNAVLGIQSSNLMGVDWRDRESLLEWLNTHGDEHRQAATILNLG